MGKVRFVFLLLFPCFAHGRSSLSNVNHLFASFAGHLIFASVEMEHASVYREGLSWRIEEAGRSMVL